MRAARSTSAKKNQVDESQLQNHFSLSKYRQEFIFFLLATGKFREDFYTSSNIYTNIESLTQKEVETLKSSLFNYFIPKGPNNHSLVKTPLGEVELYCFRSINPSTSLMQNKDVNPLVLANNSAFVDYLNKNNTKSSLEAFAMLSSKSIRQNFVNNFIDLHSTQKIIEKSRPLISVDFRVLQNKEEMKYIYYFNTNVLNRFEDSNSVIENIVTANFYFLKASHVYCTLKQQNLLVEMNELRNLAVSYFNSVFKLDSREQLYYGLFKFMDVFAGANFQHVNDEVLLEVQMSCKTLLTIKQFICQLLIDSSSRHIVKEFILQDTIVLMRYIICIIYQSEDIRQNTQSFQSIQEKLEFMSIISEQAKKAEFDLYYKIPELDPSYRPYRRYRDAVIHLCAQSLPTPFGPTVLDQNDEEQLVVPEEIYKHLEQIVYRIKKSISNIRNKELFAFSVRRIELKLDQRKFNKESSDNKSSIEQLHNLHQIESLSEVSITFDELMQFTDDDCQELVSVLSKVNLTSLGLYFYSTYIDSDEQIKRIIDALVYQKQLQKFSFLLNRSLITDTGIYNLMNGVKDIEELKELDIEFRFCSNIIDNSIGRFVEWAENSSTLEKADLTLQDCVGIREDFLDLHQICINKVKVKITFDIITKLI